MDLAYLHAIVAFLGTTLELTFALACRFFLRKDHSLRTSQTRSDAYAARSRLRR